MITTQHRTFDMYDYEPSRRLILLPNGSIWLLIPTLY